MSNTILLSVDVFNPNRDLLKYGVFTAKNLSATLLLFDAHFKTVVIPHDYVGAGGPVIQVIDNEEKVKEAKTRLAELYKELSAEWYLTRAKLVTDPVPAWKGEKEYYIIQELKEEKPTLIILDIKSHFSFLNEMLGTPETEVAEKADCPVLLLPETVVYSPITDINYLLEREKPMAEVVEEITFLKDMSDTKRNKTNINLLYYFKEEEEIAEKELALKKSILLKETGYDKLTFMNLSTHDIEKEIQDNIQQYTSDVFAFPNRNKNFLERLTSNDNTKRLILKSKIPVLVF